MKDVVITAAVRTPIGKFGGVFKPLSGIDLGTAVIKGVLQQNNLSVDRVDEVIMGNLMQQFGAGGNPTRQAAYLAGIPEQTPAFSVNKNCASGMRAVVSAIQSIRCGDNRSVIAGGFENLTNVPYLDYKTRWGNKMGSITLDDALQLGYSDPLCSNISMGMTAENLAKKYNITREEQDAWAVMSQNRAEAAIKAGKFKHEIIPVEITDRKGNVTIIDTDEHPTFGTTIESLAKLKPAFMKDGTVTAGNASGINDGASALVLMEADYAKEIGAKPLARIVAYASAGCSPDIMGIGPFPATVKALEKAGLQLSDIGLIECNEAFAAQIIAVERELKWNRDIVNVNGSGIALGHPVGSTGSKIIVSLVHEMQRRNIRYGLATLCIGGGQGETIIVENIH